MGSRSGRSSGTERQECISLLAGRTKTRIEKAGSSITATSEWATSEDAPASPPTRRSGGGSAVSILAVILVRQRMEQATRLRKLGTASRKHGTSLPRPGPRRILNCGDRTETGMPGRIRCTRRAYHCRAKRLMIARVVSVALRSLQPRCRDTFRSLTAA